MLTTANDESYGLDPLVAIIQEATENVTEEVQPAEQGAAENATIIAKARQRESYTVRDKLAMVRKFQNFDPPISMRKFSLQYGIPPNTFKVWVKLYEKNIPEELATIESQSRRRIRPGKFTKVEDKILEFFKSRDASTEGRIDVQNLRELIDVWCKEILTEEEQDSFKITPSWLQRVLRRNSITDVDGVDILVANGAFSELEGPMLENATTMPNEQDIQIITEKFIGKKRLRQPLETDSQTTRSQTSNRRPRPPRINTPRRSNMNSSSNGNVAVHVQMQDENPLELFAQMVPTHDGGNHAHPPASSSNSHVRQQQHAANVGGAVHIHFGQVVISLNTIAQYCHQMNQPQLLEMTNQLSAFLQSTHAALGSVDNGLPSPTPFHSHPSSNQLQQQQLQHFTRFS